MDHFEEIAEHFINERRNGKHPEITAYIAQYPDFAEEINDLFPALILLENGGQKESLSSFSSFGLNSSEVAQCPVNIDDYKIIREIGRGGMGIVYEAEDEILERHVALKVLRHFHGEESQSIKRFRREAQTAAKLHHTNIVPVFGYGIFKDQFYYVMQYIKGASLDELMQQLIQQKKDSSSSKNIFKWPTLEPELLISQSDKDDIQAKSQSEPFFSPHESNKNRWSGLFLSDFCDKSLSHYIQKVCDIGIQLAHALQYAHNQRIIHRDIKPANLILDDQGIVWITDFGLAKPYDDNDITQFGQLIGTLRYMSPESLEGEFSVQSDIYSLGLSLYELLTLTPAFDETHYSRLLIQVSRSEIVPLRKLNRSIPKDLETIIHKATAKNPKQRYQSAADFADDLTRFLEDRPIHARRITKVERFWRLCKRNRLTSGLITTIFILLVTLSIFMTIAYFHSQSLLYEKEYEKIHAQTNLDLAIYAFDDIFSLFIGKEEIFPFLGHNESLSITLDEPLITEKEADILETLLKFYDRYVIENEDNQNLLKETARAYVKMGLLRYRLGHSEASIDSCKNAMKFYEKGLKIVQDKQQYQLEMIVVMNKFLSQLRMPMLNDSFFRNTIDQMINTLETIPETSELQSIRRQELSSLLFSRVCLVFFDCIKSHQKRELNDFENRKSSVDFIEVFNNDRSFRERIEKDLNKCRQLTEQLYNEEPNSADLIFGKSKILCLVALYKMMDNNHLEANQHIQESLALADLLLNQNPDDSRFKINKINLLLLSSFVLKFNREVDQNEILNLLNTALTMSQELTNDHPLSPQYVTFMIFVQSSHAVYYFENKMYDLSEEYFQQTEVLLHKFAINFPHFHDYELFAAPHYFHYIELLIAQNRLDKAQEKLDQFSQLICKNNATQENKNIAAAINNASKETSMQTRDEWLLRIKYLQRIIARNNQ